jgi:protein phosphatase
MITVTWGASTGAGAVRAVNQDAFLAQPPVFVVADGMGGHAGGEVASETVVSAFRALAGVPAVRRQDVEAVLDKANEDIVHTAHGVPGLHGMGTTVVGLALLDDGDGKSTCAAFNVGDSRLYRLANGVLQQVTKDHSLLQELVDDGLADTASEQELRDAQHVLTRALGSPHAPLVDWFTFDTTPGERYLLCSDGLPGEIPDAVMADVLTVQGSPAQAAEALVRSATAAGARDNVTAVVIDVLVVVSAGTAMEADTPTMGRPSVSERG